MQNLARQQQGKIDVFYCGPAQLATTLTEKCSEYGFAFSREIFWKFLLLCISPFLKKIIYSNLK